MRARVGVSERGFAWVCGGSRRIAQDHASCAITSKVLVVIKCGRTRSFVNKDVDVRRTRIHSRKDTRKT